MTVLCFLRNMWKMAIFVQFKLVKIGFFTFPFASGKRFLQKMPDAKNSQIRDTAQSESACAVLKGEEQHSTHVKSFICVLRCASRSPALSTCRRLFCSHIYVLLYLFCTCYTFVSRKRNTMRCTILGGKIQQLLLWKKVMHTKCTHTEKKGEERIYIENVIPNSAVFSFRFLKINFRKFSRFLEEKL